MQRGLRGFGSELSAQHSFGLSGTSRLSAALRSPAISLDHHSSFRASRTHASAAATSLRLAPCIPPRLSRTSSNATRACCSIQRSPRRTRTPGAGMVTGLLAMSTCQSMRATRIILVTSFFRRGAATALSKRMRGRFRRVYGTPVPMLRSARLRPRQARLLRSCYRDSLLISAFFRQPTATLGRLANLRLVRHL